MNSEWIILNNTILQAAEALWKKERSKNIKDNGLIIPDNT